MTEFSMRSIGCLYVFKLLILFFIYLYYVVYLTQATLRALGGSVRCYVYYLRAWRQRRPALLPLRVPTQTHPHRQARRKSVKVC